MAVQQQEQREHVQDNLDSDIKTSPAPIRKPLPMWLRSLPVLVVALLCLSLLVISHGQLGLWKWLEELHWFWSLLVFILLFTMVSLPFGFGYVILNMMCGYLYGFVRGQLIVMVSVIVGFSLAFSMCRSLFKDYTRGMVTSTTTLQALLQVIDGPNGFKIILLTRLTPIPFGLQTVMFAVTQVSLYECLLASVLGLLPLQLLNTYVGSTVRNMQEIVSDGRTHSYVILAGQIVSSVFLMTYLLQKAKRELAKHARVADIESGVSNNA